MTEQDLLEGKVDLIVVDLHMPPETPEYGKYGGLAILKRIFRTRNHCRSVVAATSRWEDLKEQEPTTRATIEKLEREEDLIIVDRSAARAEECTLFRQIIASRKGRRLLSPRIERQILFLGRTNGALLILGERGSGKEGVARSIHTLGVHTTTVVRSVLLKR